MAKKIAIGLDIGGTALRAAEVASDARGSNVELQRYAEVPLPLNAVRDGEVIDAATVVQGLKALWVKGGFTSKDVIVGVGNQRVAVRPLTMPQMPMEQLQAALPFQVSDLLPMPVEEALLGFYPTIEHDGQRRVPSIRRDARGRGARNGHYQPPGGRGCRAEAGSRRPRRIRAAPHHGARRPRGGHGRLRRHRFARHHGCGGGRRHAASLFARSRQAPRILSIRLRAQRGQDLTRPLRCSERGG